MATWERKVVLKRFKMFSRSTSTGQSKVDFIKKQETSNPTDILTNITQIWLKMPSN